MRRLGLLTRAEVARMQELYASGPLQARPVDAGLIAKGWAAPYDDEPATDCSPGAYRKDNGAPCLYDEQGSVQDCWRERS
jgi:hypothetical protein